MLQKYLDQYSTGKTVLLLFVITNIVYAAMLMYTIPYVMQFSGGIKLLDMMPLGYDINYILSLMESLGEDGRINYLVVQLRIDMIYPLLFAVSYSLMMMYLLKQIGKDKSFLFYLCTLPILAGLADYSENFGIITIIKSYPDITTMAAQMTNVFSIVKSMSTSLFFVSLIVVLTVWAIQSIKNKLKA
ncbi:hypothetical protein [Labilibacter marinus]|uniref:hypothetical protein n=1 Tax=Labilibacter marinus TaxID=1477105 RepID=UPI0018E9A7EA|nr:hypothetical protein [Labilibacter marinus]